MVHMARRCRVGTQSCRLRGVYASSHISEASSTHSRSPNEFQTRYCRMGGLQDLCQGLHQRWCRDCIATRLKTVFPVRQAKSELAANLLPLARFRLLTSGWLGGV